MTEIYDNHANDIVFFDLHKKPKNKTNLDSLTNDELADLELKVGIKRENLTYIASQTKDQNVIDRLNKINGFYTIVRIAMKKRKISTLSDCQKSILFLEAQISELKEKQVSDSKIKELEKENKKLNEKIKKLGVHIASQNVEICKNKEIEKTKRTELSANKNAKTFQSLKVLLFKELGEDKTLRLLENAELLSISKV